MVDVAVRGTEAAPAGEVDLACEGARAATRKVVAPANYNCPQQTVIAGDAVAVEVACTRARQEGAKHTIPLTVSAPFHCELMRPAREALTPLLEATEFHDPRVPVMTNVDAAPATTGAAARDALMRQIDSPVRWVESVERLIADHGVERFVEIGIVVRISHELIFRRDGRDAYDGGRGAIGHRRSP